MGGSKNAQTILNTAPTPTPKPAYACGAHVSGLAAVPYLSRKALHQLEGISVSEPKTNSKPQRLSLKCLHRSLVQRGLPLVSSSPSPVSVGEQDPTLKPNTRCPASFRERAAAHPHSDWSTRPGPSGSLPFRPQPPAHRIQQTMKANPSTDWELQHQVQSPWKASLAQLTLPTAPLCPLRSFT